MGAKKVAQNAVQDGVKAEPTLQDVMNLILGQQAQAANQQNQINAVAQALAKILPGTGVAPANRQNMVSAPEPAKEQLMANCSLEATTDPRGAFIAILGKKHMGLAFGGDGKINSRGVIMSYMTERVNGYSEKIHGWAKVQGQNLPIKTVNFSGQLPVGTVIQTHDGYGYDFYTQTEQGAILTDEARALELAKK